MFRQCQRIPPGSKLTFRSRCMCSFRDISIGDGKSDSENKRGVSTTRKETLVTEESSPSISSRLSSKLKTLFQKDEVSSRIKRKQSSQLSGGDNSSYRLPAIVNAMSGLYNLRDTGTATSGIDDGATLFLAAKELLRRVRVGIKNGLISVCRGQSISFFFAFLRIFLCCNVHR